jgi:hypothetical protein
MSARSAVVSLIALALLLAGILSRSAISGDANAVADDAPRTETMQALAGGLATAFGSSLKGDRFREEANRALLRNALVKLARGAEDLLAHGEEFGKSTEHLRMVMARDAEQALADFEAGQFDDAQRRVHQLLEHCFACHTRLPEPGRSALGKRITQGTSLRNLDLEERVFFLVATRQFDRALATIETALRSPGEVPTRITWLFEAYLKLSIRVNRSYGEAREALEDSLEASALPRCLEARVRTWIRALAELEARRTHPVNLRTARMLIDEGRRRNEFPADNRGLVHFVAASGLLLRFLENHDGRDDQKAEAYFLLGVVETHISSGLWTDQTDFYLETAIRLHPHSQLAMQAYSFLQGYVIFKHSGASGAFVPDSMWTHLDTLRALAEPARSPSRM